MDIIKLKRATKSVANTSTKVLEKDEVLVITPDSGSGKGKCQLKFGDGVTAIKSLPIAIDGENADEMKVPTITTASDENPVLSAGETIKVFFGKIKKKFTYLENLLGNVKTVTNLFGSNDAKTVAQGLQNLVNTKFNKSDLYDGTDSTSTSLGATANALRKVNEKTDNNTSSISTLNSNLKVGTTTVLASGQAGAIRTSNIIFDTSFSKMPSISVAIYNEYPSVFQATISKVTKLGFSLYLETIKETSEQSVLVHWIASAK
ncbi:H-type lectin domain-containing protein [Enterocloster clostridioformis]|uniref:Phage tail fibre repeat-containing protein n=1 Tax=Enterocloster clostridioformis TaxID=1531 RepID=A0A1I0KES8_9FIRM|nr:H-type lectin domain-containing protein [Enterocloster clostridioformis]SEU22865.1 Phage tail fibre repeat-containing protein [Enterocloster clostridioformis]SEW49423.1 Phage tail fibre repeat-containing protein [Enterocloster clostridioformis]